MKRTLNGKTSSPKLSLGPLFFHWTPEKRRDFYFRVADEMDVDSVYLGEVVCSKREPFFAPYFEEVLERLKSSGKEVVLSTLAMVTLPREMEEVRAMAGMGLTVEANDVSCVQALEGRPFVVGPFINVFNEGAIDCMKGKGGVRIVLPVELSTEGVGTLARYAAKHGVETEVQVFGRQPLAVSMRCYHARARGLHKDNCQFSCETDPDGMIADTLDGQHLLAVNGTQTLSYGYAALLSEMAQMAKSGVGIFRLSPHAVDMVAVAALYRRVLAGKIAPDGALAALATLAPAAEFINGYARGREGMAKVGAGEARIDAKLAKAN